MNYKPHTNPLICVLALFFIPVLANANKLVAVYNESYPPFSFLENNQIKGIEVDLLEELAHRLHKTIKHRGLPWARAQEEVRNGKADFFITIPTSDREKYAEMSFEPFLTVAMVGVALKENPKFAEMTKAKTLDDAKKFSQVNYLGSGWAMNNLTGAKIDYFHSTQSMFNFLIAQRANMFIDNEINIRYNIAKLKMSDRLLVLPNSFAQAEFRLGISKLSKALQLKSKISAAITAMKKDGTLERILLKYGFKISGENFVN